MSTSTKTPTKKTPAAVVDPAAPKRARDLLKATSQPIHPFDLAQGTDTSGLLPANHLLTGHPNDTHVTAYYGVAPSILRTLIEHWLETQPAQPIERYTFVDIGAGKGRAMLVASEYPFREVLGIELNPAMAAIARANTALWQAAHTTDTTAHPIAPLSLFEQDALEFDPPRTPTLLFLFHPFEAPVLKALLHRIENRFAGRPHPLDILYVNAECADVLDRHPAFFRLWSGSVPMSPEDHVADLAAIAQQKEYGSTGDEECAIYRYTGQPLSTA